MRKKDPLGTEKAVVLRSCNLTLETTQHLEEQVKKHIKDGNLVYADLLSVKTILDANQRAFCELYELDCRIRKLICMDEWDLGKKAVAFFDEREISD